MTTIIFEKGKAWSVDDEGDTNVEIFQNESGKFGVRLVSVYSNDTALDGCYLFNSLEMARKAFLKFCEKEES